MSLVEDLIYAVRATGTTKAAEEIDTVTGSVTKSEEQAKKATRAHVGLGGAFGRLKNMAVGLASTAGIAGVGYGLEHAVSKAIDFQNQQVQLGASIRANVRRPAADATKQMAEFADSLSMKGGFDPAESIAGMTQLLRVTHDVDKAQRDMNLATEIARGTHKSLAATTRAVTMAEAGRTQGLTRMGIILPKGVKGAQAIAQLQRQFAGATTAYNKTAAGAAANFRNSLDVLQERLGAALLPAITKVANGLSGFVRGMVEGRGAGGRLVQIFKDLIGYGKQVYEWMRKNSTVVEMVGGAILGVVAAIKLYNVYIRIANALTAITEAEMLWPLVILAAILAVVGALVVAYLKVKWFRDAVNAVWRWIKNATLDLVHAIVGVFQWFANAVGNVIAFVRNHWRQLILLLGLLGLTIDIVTKHWNFFKNLASTVINWVVGAVKWMINAIRTTMSTLTTILTAPWRWAWQHVIQPVMNWIVGAVRWMVQQVEKIIAPILKPIGKIIGAVGTVAKGAVGVGKSVLTLGGVLQHGGPVTRSATYLVGERGPELVNLPAGSNVTPNSALGTGEQPPIILYNILDGKVLSKSVVRQGLLQQSRM